MIRLHIRPRSGLAVFTVWAAALALVACDDDYHIGPFTDPDSIIGSGVVISESRAVSGFHGLLMHGVGRAVIEQTGRESLVISAEDNILPWIRSEVAGGLLELGPGPGANLSPRREILYDVTVRELDELRLSGACRVEAASLETGILSADLSGATAVELAGRALQQDIVVSGAARYEARDLESRVVSLNVSGAASAVVRASERLDIVISGSASVVYYGDPELHVTGNGSVRRGGP